MRSALAPRGHVDSGSLPGIVRGPFFVRPVFRRRTVCERAVFERARAEKREAQHVAAHDDEVDFDCEAPPP